MMFTFTSHDLDVALPAIGSLLVPQLPVLLVYVVGMVLSIMRWRRHPGVSMLTVAAMLILLAVTVGSSAIYVMLSISSSSRHMRASEISEMHRNVTIVRSIIYAAGLGTWLAAVFMGRGEGETGFGSAFPVQSPPPPLPPNRFR